MQFKSLTDKLYHIVTSGELLNMHFGDCLYILNEIKTKYRFIMINSEELNSYFNNLSKNKYSSRKSVNSYNSCSINSGKRLIFISYILTSPVVLTILNK